MSEHLFVDPRAVRTPSRQPSVVAASIVLHAALVVALLLIGILVPGVLPSPRVTAIAWAVQQVRLADIPLPAMHVDTKRPTVPATPPATGAPVDAPTGIAPESTLPPPIPVTPGFVEGPGAATLSSIDAPPPPPPAPPQTAGPVRLHSGIVAPVKVRDIVPQYSAIARTAGASGLVIIEATIDTNGDVVNTRVLRSVPLLDEAALAAVRQWKYTPARLNGEPVSVLITVTVNFTLAGR